MASAASASAEFSGAPNDLMDEARIHPARLAASASQDPVRALAALPRLPAGLLRARAVHLLREPPPAPPLAPGSDWYALGEVLAVTCAPEGLPKLLSDLAAYAWIAARLYGARLNAEEAEAEASWLLVQERLGLEASDLSRARAEHPGLARELGWMAEWPFEAELHIHPQVRPAWLSAQGEAAAERLLSALAGRRAWLWVTEDPSALELLSPYARELSAPLQRWADENPAAIRLEGLHAAIAEGSVDDWALSALVAQELLSAAPELLSERRAAEAGQGLFLEDVAGVSFGWVDPAELRAPDPALKLGAAPGVLLTGMIGPLQHAMARALFAEGAVSATGVCYRGLRGEAPCAPPALYSPEDGFFLGLAPFFQDELRRAPADVRGVVSILDHWDEEVDPIPMPATHPVLPLLRAARWGAARQGANPEQLFVLRIFPRTFKLGDGISGFTLARAALRTLGGAKRGTQRGSDERQFQDRLQAFSPRYRA